MVIEITDQNFEKEVLKTDLPVLVDFWASWCGPCKRVSPVVDKLSESYNDKVKFCKVNIEEARDTASKYGIMSIPTLMFFKNGENVDGIVGAVPEEIIKSKIERLLYVVI
ncbi:MAG: thioredoxin [Spirochaetota bacterium]|nr:thioredoxin [Spirochaetota bacterium]